MAAAHAIHNPATNLEAGLGHLVRAFNASPLTRNGMWADAAATTWWTVWGKRAAHGVAEWAGPLAPGVTDATGARHRVVYAQVARALRDQGGHPVTRIAEWLDVTRATVYNYLAADAH